MIGNWTSSELLQRVAGSLLHFVWEGAVLAFVAAVLLRLLSHRSAVSRYAVSVAVLGLMLLAPCVTFVFYGETGVAAAQVLQFLRPSLAEAGRVAGTAGAALWTGWIVTLWVAGAAIFWIRLIAGWILSNRLIRSATTAVPAQVHRMLDRVRAAMPVRRAVRLRIGERVGSPVVFGWLRPVILLPASVLTGLNEDQLLAVLAHELAHVRRHDFLVNALQRAVESVLFYHPAVWWLSGRIRAERELCCDDLAVSVCGDRLVYAQALVELERVRASAPVLAVPAASGSVASRIRRLAGFEETNRDWLPAAAALLIVIACAVAGAAHTAIAAVPTRPLAAIASPPSPPPSPPLSMVREPGPVEGALSAAAAILTAQSTPARGQSAPVITAARESARKQLFDLHVDYSVEVFIKQAAEGDVIVVRTFLAAGMNPNLAAVYDFPGVGYKENELVRQGSPAVTTALIAAAANGQTEIVQLLLAANADVTLKTRPTSTTALSRAASRGHLDAVRLLLGASPGHASQSGNLALLEAARNGHESVVRALLDAGVAPNPASSSDASAVYDAACAGHTGVLRALLEKGGDSNARSNPYSGEPALSCALSRGNWAAATVLVERGADVNASNSNGSTVLGSVLGVSNFEGRLKMLTLLLDKGANIDVPISRDGQTPLWRAIASLSTARNGVVRGGNPDRELTEVVKLLISRGANINLKGGTTPTSPLYEAARNGMTDIVQVLLGKGADVTTLANGGSLLTVAARYPETAEVLRKAGAQ